MPIMRKAMIALVVTMLAAATLAACVVPRHVPPHATPSRHYYLALGDSITTGAQPDEADRYYRPDGFVPRVWKALHQRDPRLELENLGCGGESTVSMLHGATPDASACGGPVFYELVYRHTETQLAAAVQFLRDHAGKVDLITLTIGGNDVQDPACGAALPACLARLGDRLDQILDALQAAAPRARIVGTTIYNPIACVYPHDPGQATYVQQLLQQANQTLVGVYRAHHAVVADVAAAFAVDDIQENAARAAAWTWFCSPDHAGDVHPNDNGYAVFADTVLSAIGGS
jgi:lysophospholipase L1-like esterase